MNAAVEGLVRTRAGSIVLGIVAVAALASGARSALLLVEDHRESSGREAALAAASAEVAGLISVSDATTSADIDRLEEGATAGFAAQLAEQSAALRKALRQANISSKGSVASAGVVAWQPEKARVVVAAVGNVSTGADRTTTPRAYRLRVDLRAVEGRWLVSDMEFVA